ncbi:hypothetical protein JHK87_016624 [Glycine soja]|nr:hypothetical protein JHK87_016624 [Glycine soja]
MPKRVPLSHITNLFNNSLTSTTFTLSHHQQQFRLSSPLPRRTCTILSVTGLKHNYGEALTKSILFFEGHQHRE